MPELPEVETVKNTLIPKIVGKKITNVIINYLPITDNYDFKKEIINQHITDIKRKGKFLIFILESNALVTHLRMEGKFYIKRLDESVNKHEHVIIELDNEISLRYHDTRKFGRMQLRSKSEYSSVSPISQVADEPFEIDPNSLFKKLSKKSIPIKMALLDQRLISGIGNIYADEILFLSKINPLEKSSKITLNETKTIVNNASKTLNKAISLGGTTIYSYTSSLGVSGKFQNELLVHTKKGLDCPACKNKIIKIQVGGRGTYYCPNCQKLKQQIIGLTGGIASGKTTTTNYLKSKNFLVIDNDSIVHDLWNDQVVVESIRKSFKIKKEDFSKKLISQLIFSDKTLRKKLEGILHPLVFKKIDEVVAINKNESVIFIDMPLLYEVAYQNRCDKVILVYTSYENQTKRLIERDKLSAEDAKKRIESQMSLEEKKKKADFVIDNSTSIKDLYLQIDNILKEMRCD